MEEPFYKGAFKDGEFQRPETKFRQWVRADGSTAFQVEAGRYHLYVSLACPWSHRTVILRSVRKLQDVIGMSDEHALYVKVIESPTAPQMEFQSGYIELRRINHKRCNLGAEFEK